MDLPKRFVAFRVGFFSVSGQNKQKLSKAGASLKRIKFLVPLVFVLGSTVLGIKFRFT